MLKEFKDESETSSVSSYNEGDNDSDREDRKKPTIQRKKVKLAKKKDIEEKDTKKSSECKC
eukprot:CAMPEP_0170548338 /NCGR_PEP_ID=MMETSP0211-20121228/6661_1 /TAXON_ID=311385 /ORGANISM="Pseudokeronopsis sp., Strain OXSARD2" /LENGTH=60 /DNA_ID=CAMNT_0010853833 /DNA_START=639 /DNA_END=818 /DNA_ORIENTATION=+